MVGASGALRSAVPWYGIANPVAPATIPDLQRPVAVLNLPRAPNHDQARLCAEPQMRPPPSSGSWLNCRLMR
jgi:hypothetical protein